MSGRLDGAGIAALLRGAAETVIANEAVLTKADGAIGDGDHGIGMARGFKAALAALDRLGPEPSPKAAFAAVGTAVLSSAGGASGAVFGTLFGAAGKALSMEALDPGALAAALAAGAEAVMARGKAKAGDKTMLDALLPGVEAMRDGAAEGWAVALGAAVSAARQGGRDTAGMTAGTGRAKMLGARALGHPDPGALTMGFLFEGMEKAFLAAPPPADEAPAR